jgi:hypothetical protein
MKKSSLIIVLTALLTAGGCNRNTDVESVPFHIGDKRIASALMGALDKEGIPYERTGEDSFLIAEADAKKAFAMLKMVGREIIPPNRNASFEYGGISIARDALDEKGLEYEVIEIFGNETLIWSEENNEVIQAVLSKLPVGRAEQSW